MNHINPQDLPQFLRKYRFAGGRIRGVRVLHSTKQGTVVEFRLAAREAVADLGTAPGKVRLKLRVAGVEEFRFQMRPGQPKAKIVDARLAYLNGLFFVTFDPVTLDPGERVKVHDFRASDVYAAGRELLWETVSRDPEGSA
jgi:hypothetical protein